MYKTTDIDNDEEILFRFALKREIDSLTAMTNILEYMKSGYMPELPETKKAAQTAVRELCAALCEFADKL